MKTLKNIIILFLFSLLFFNCNNRNVAVLDTPTSGNTKIGVDETLLPVIKSEIDVFEATYDKAKIHSTYCSERDLFNLFFQDSVKMIVASRELNKREKAYLKSVKQYPNLTLIAIDAIAIIVNKQNNDSLISVNTLKNIVSGEIVSWKKINKESNLDKIKLVFDNPSSSTVRYIFDSVCMKQLFSKKHIALKCNSDVIKYVSNNPNAIGIIGLSWISDKEDTVTQSNLKKVRLVSVSEQKVATCLNSYKPYQSCISNNDYPLCRNIYIINKEPRLGLASGLTTFIAGEKGQKIILKSGIVPSKAIVRMVQIND
ncbi:MAG: substrate-binding domain-containing protein [Bacteroidota bacterium]